MPQLCPLDISLFFFLFFFFPFGSLLVFVLQVHTMCFLYMYKSMTRFSFLPRCFWLFLLPTPICRLTRSFSDSLKTFLNVKCQILSPSVQLSPPSPLLLSFFLWFSIFTLLVSPTSSVAFAVSSYLDHLHLFYVPSLYRSQSDTFRFFQKQLTVQWWTPVLVCPNVSSFVHKPDVVVWVCGCVCVNLNKKSLVLVTLFVCMLAAFPFSSHSCR